MGKTPKAPTPPDPKKTADAQAGMNKETAIAQANLNNVNQYTPDGSLTYQITGYNSDGTPKYSATTALSAQNQKLYDQYKQTEANLSQSLASRGQADFSNEATEARLFGLGRTRLDPKFSQDEESLRTRLVNQGIRSGTEAWDNEFRNFNAGKNDAYNSLLLNGRQQAVSEALAERNQPFNELMALRNGSQLTPQYQGSNTPIANTDYAGLVANNYNTQMQQWQQKVANKQGMMGGLFGLGGTLLQGAFGLSDRRVKDNVERVGTLPNGLPLYVFDYIGGERGVVGVMADEAHEVVPDAVITGSDGFDRVNYVIAGV